MGRNGAARIELDGLVLDPLSYKVFIKQEIGWEKVPLNTKEFNLLHYFMLNQRIYISPSRLLEAVWHYDTWLVNTTTVRQTVCRMQRKLKQYGKYIKTRRDVGYTIEETK